MTARPDPRPAGLEHLLAALRAAGLPVGAHEVLRLHHVFALAPGLDQDRPPEAQLRDLLASALTHDPAERRTFDDVFEPWAERWSRSVNRDPGAPAPDLSPLPELAGPRTAARRRPRRRSWMAAAGLLAAALLAVVLIPRYAEVGPKPPPPPPVVESPKEVHTVWLAPAGATIAAAWRPDWTLIALGALALIAGALALWRYRRKSWIPDVLPEPLPGPARLPLLPLAAGGPELLDAGGAETLIWGVDRHVTKRLTPELDLEATARETARAGGIPELRFEPEKRLREVWLWLDGTVEDQAMERWADEIARSLERAGLPVRIGGFDGVPDEVLWDEGHNLRPIEVEAHRETALVAICTDGEVLLRQLEDERGAGVRPLLRSLAAWQRLAIVDVSRGNETLRRALGAWGLAVVAPEELPAFFGLGAARPAEPEAVDPGEVRAWRAALALGARPIDRPTAYAARRALGLELSPWAFHLLAEGEPADPERPERLGGRLVWSEGGRAAMVGWLAEGSLDEPSGIRKSSLLDRALDFWRERLESEAARRAERVAIEPWADRPAQRHLQMERALLRLWREPRLAAEELFELGSGELAEALRGRLERLAPRDARRPDDGLIPLPWRVADLDDRSLYLLAERGLNGLRRGALTSSGRLGLGLGVLAGAAVWLLYAGGVGRIEEVVAQSGITAVEAEAPPGDGRTWVETSWVGLEGGTFRMGSETQPTIAWGKETPAHDVTVGDFWIGQTEVTNAQYRVFKPDHAPGAAGDLPAVDVSWIDARNYCQSLRRGEYDLPTEAEWEYAARAGTTTAWSFGDDAERLGEYAWFGEDFRTGKAHSVGEKKANPWGLRDMHGNVWEWVRDCYEEYDDRADPDTAIPDQGLIPGTCHQSDALGARRVLRGGAFDDGPGVLRSAIRYRFEPELSRPLIGFRCVRRAGRQLDPSTP